jgi:hypothetical protein
MVPAYEYLSLRAKNLDLPGAEDSLDVELAGFGQAAFVRTEGDPAGEGDVSVANVLYHHDGRYLRFGRQHAAGGAARYTRFDGLSAGADLVGGLAVGFYAGFSVLPRWNRRPGYYYLGAAADSLSRDPQGLPDPERAGNWLGGFRMSYEPHHTVRGALSFHQQYESDELAQRRVGAEGGWLVGNGFDVSGRAILDTAAARLADAQVVGDWFIAPVSTISFEYLHSVPALFLSHQSVLSVFSIDSYDEAGAIVAYHPSNSLRAEGSGFLQYYAADDIGLRSELRLYLIPDSAERITLQSIYGRLWGDSMGYHSARNSLRYRVSSEITATADSGIYIYDHAISGQRFSTLYAANLEWSNDPGLTSSHARSTVQHLIRVLWGASWLQSPTARADVQTLIRLIYSFEETH